MIRLFAPAICAGAVATLPTLAQAHVGHVGELAGHSHWAGIAALAGAALLAGIVAVGRARARRNSRKTDEEQTAGAEAPQTVRGSEA
ncbi:DUF6732 family protein [Stappia indica]|uniref:DUF6732 family protein n=1 Tax=Stappia indica TaxID=538381 RepID=UPI001CD6B821|nr:DUF6732 family protein [Stappia indica]MCA1299111.1 hypothetical protein [Stappia indica]